jgi:hypothetical protein
MTDKLCTFSVFVTIAIKHQMWSDRIIHLRSNNYWILHVCLYSCFSYPAYKLHIFCTALYYCILFFSWDIPIVFLNSNLVLLSVPHLAVPNILHYLINGTIIRKVTAHKMCVLLFSTTFVWNISHSRKNSVICYHKYT